MARKGWEIESTEFRWRYLIWPKVCFVVAVFFTIFGSNSFKRHQRSTMFDSTYWGANWCPLKTKKESKEILSTDKLKLSITILDRFFYHSVFRSLILFWKENELTHYVITEWKSFCFAVCWLGSAQSHGTHHSDLNRMILITQTGLATIFGKVHTRERKNRSKNTYNMYLYINLCGDEKTYSKIDLDLYYDLSVYR